MNGPSPQRQSPSQPGTGGKARAGFPRSARLLRHADFERVYKQGQRHFARHMTLFFLRREEGGSRVGFTVGRVLGGAVERNRIKRRLREAVRRQRARLKARVDVVVNPKKSVQAAEFTEILEEFRRAFDAISAKSRSGNEDAR